MEATSFAKAGPAEELKHMQEAHEANDGSPPEPGDQRRALPCARGSDPCLGHHFALPGSHLARPPPQ